MNLLLSLTLLLSTLTMDSLERFVDIHPEMREQVFSVDGTISRFVSQNPAMFTEFMTAYDTATTGTETIEPINLSVDALGNIAELPYPDGTYPAHRTVALADTLLITRVSDVASLPIDPLRRPQHVSGGAGKLVAWVRSQDPRSTATVRVYTLVVPVGYEIVTQFNSGLEPMR